MGKLSSNPWLWAKKRESKSRDSAGASTESSDSIGVLCFEVASLMSKAVNLWNSLSHVQILRLRDEVFQMEGIRKLVSDDEDFLSALALAEIMDSFKYLASSIARLGKRCRNPVLQQFDAISGHLLSSRDAPDLFGFQYAGKKMERRANKMERLARSSSNLQHELETLAELEQTLQRMQVQAHLDSKRRGACLADFKHKVALQRQHVNYLRETSLWNRSYDYTVRLLARSIVTIHARIKHVHPSESTGLPSEAADVTIDGQRLARIHAIWKHRHSWKKTATSKWSSAVAARPFSGCVAGELADSPISPSSYMQHKAGSFRTTTTGKPSTLGAAALALHYANVVVAIEKLAASPHAIGPDERDGLYGMLPASIRSSLKARLKDKPSSLSVPNILGAEWRDALAAILGWIAPLAHNTIRWQSDRNFERRHLVSGSNILLLQTLHFANQARSEDAITELLFCLNNLWRSRCIDDKCKADFGVCKST